MWSSMSLVVSRRLSTSFCNNNSKNVMNKQILSLPQRQQKLVLLIERPPSKAAACSHVKGQLRSVPRHTPIEEHCRLARVILPTETMDGQSGTSRTTLAGSNFMKCEQTEKQHIMSPTNKCASQKAIPSGESSGSIPGGEEPLLFSVESSGYHHALDTIATAREAGDLCSSAAARLKDLCHLLHMESVIRAAAVPCCHHNTTDDIVIRRAGAPPVSPSQGCLHPNQGDGSCNTEDSLRASVCNEQTLPSSRNRMSLDSEMPPPCNGAVFCSGVDGESHRLLCGEAPRIQTEDQPQSDGPSKEQLAYMHHRLSEEMPRFFEQHHDYGLYVDTILFDNRIMKVSTRGVTAYKATVQSLKYLITAYLIRTEMEVLRITMETEQGCIQARWRIKGVPLHSYLLRPWGRKHKVRYFDAFSTFYVGTDGLIHKHVLDKVMPSSDQVAVSSWAVRLGILLGLVRPPAFEPDIMKAINLMKSLLSK